MAAPYITTSDAETRLLSRFGVTATLTDGDVEIASDELDFMRPFIGAKLVTDGTQERAFPRSITPDGETNEETDVPGAVLDWVVLCAYRLATDDAPPVTSEGAGSVNVSYASPKPSQTDRRMQRLIEPYLLKVGSRL